MRRVVLMVVYCTLATAQVGTRSAPTILQSASEKLLSVPAFGFFGSAQSDINGDIFIHPAPFQELNILKISPSSDTTVYKLADEQAREYAFYDYSVTPGGVVWALVNETGSPVLRVIEFDSSGEAKKPVRLQIPDNIQVTRFLPLDSGLIFVLGNYSDERAQELRGRPFLGLFDGSGNLVKNVRNPPSSEPAKVPGGTVWEGACTSAEDGNAYFLGDASIVVLTPGGEISKRIQITKPDSGLVAAGLYVSKGWAAIRFHKNNSDHTIEKSFVVLQIATGQAIGWYKPSADVGYADVGFSPSDGFTFFANDHGKIKLVQAKLQ